ncbi:MAG: hypothetical protein D6791_12670 [Chloroflexi bacterium]|nr:MAG: hypothetical protein D6791_12670 [Chloroflexota bacterium]
MVSGFRFPAVTVPAGARIAEAYLVFTVDGPGDALLELQLWGEAGDDARPFDAFSKPEDRPATEATVGWTISEADVWQMGEVRRSPDVGAIVQEIVNRPGWRSGNALAIMVGNVRSDLASRRVFAFEREDSPAHTARLVVRLASASPGVGVAILDRQGKPVTALTTNADGWPTPNPLQVRVTLQCTDLAGCDFYPFRLNLHSQDGRGRFYVFSNPLPDDVCPTTITGSTNSQRALEVFCSRLSLLYQESATYTWQVWVQPSEDTQIVAEASYGPVAQDVAGVEVPQAAIHPVVFIPGTSATHPPSYQGSLALANFVYTALYATLEKMGYEQGKTLFQFPWDWLASHMVSARHLGDFLKNIATPAVESVAWVDFAGGVKFDLIGHSGGGLVARVYVQSDYWNDDVRRIILIGSPSAV